MATELENDVLRITADLIRIDTTNTFDDRGPGEREAALYVQRQLEEVGIETRIFESSERRTSVIARIPGRERGAYLLHGHLDVVPAPREGWTVDPFEALVEDGMLWGRGAIDMKNVDAMIIACARELRRSGTVPKHDLVLAFFADEEAASVYGARWLVENHPEIFDGVVASIGEVGGFGVPAPSGENVYFLEVARKGVAWFELTAHHKPGHGSITRSDSAIARLSAAVNRVTSHRWPVRTGGLNTGLVEAVQQYFGVDLTELELSDPESPLSGVDDFLRAAIRNVANVTVLDAGGAFNVVPGEARAVIDGRFLPGEQESFLAEVERLVGPEVSIRMLDVTPADSAESEGPVVDEIRRTLQEIDPGSRLVTYVASASTDSSALAPLGIPGYGFVPHVLPAGFPFAALFHSDDERVPLDALNSGVNGLYKLITLD